MVARRPRAVAGLELGAAAIKAVEVERSGSGLRVTACLVRDMPATSPGRAEALRELLQSLNASMICVALGGHDVILRRVQLPPMPEAERREAVRWQLKEQAPFPMQDALLDVEMLGELIESGAPKQDVLAAAASAASVQAVAAEVRRAGGTLTGLAPVGYAAWRCLAACLPDAARGCAALIDIGASATRVIIAEAGHIRLAREIPIGGRQMTEALIGSVRTERGEVVIDAAQAEQLKRTYGVPSDAIEGATPEGVPLFHLASLMRPVLEQLLNEVSRMIDFHRAQLNGSEPTRVWLCGGGSRLSGLPDFLARGLGIRVEAFHPLAHLSVAEGVPSAARLESGPCLVAALGSVINAKLSLNLLPRGRSGSIESARRTPARRVLIGAVIGVAVALLMGLQAAVLVLGHRLRQAERTWAAMEPEYARMMDIRARRQAKDALASDIAAFLEQQPIWDGVMKELGALTPPAIELTELRVTADHRTSQGEYILKLKGLAFTQGGAEPSGMATFLEALEASPFFTQLELVSSELQTSDQGRTVFEIDGRLR